MNTFRRLLFITIAILFSSTHALFASSPEVPDFAYPKKVAEDARKQLETALRKGRDVQAVRALLDLTLAQNAINSDSMPACLATLADVESRFSKPAPRAVINLIRAKIYADYYNSMKFDIDRRPQAPADSEDYTEWDTDRFEARVAELLNAAMASPEALLETPLRDYRSLLKIDNDDQANLVFTFFPSLLDFVGGQAIKIIKVFDNPASKALANEYRDTLIRLNADRPAPLVALKIGIIRYENKSLQDNLRRLEELYHQTLPSAFAGEALIAMDQDINPGDIPRCQHIKALIDGFIDRFPTYSRIEGLKNILAKITRRRATTTYHSVIVPGTKLKVSSTIYNINEATISLYRLPESFNKDWNTNTYHLKNGVIPPSLTLIDSLKLTLTDSVPFCAEREVYFTIPDPGHYIVVVQSQGLKPDDAYSVIHASALAAGILTFAKENDFIVINPLTGAPVEGAEMMEIWARGTLHPIGTTSADGIVPIPKLYSTSYFRPVKGDDKFALYTSAWTNSSSIDSTRTYSANIFTDLPLYHPGDSVGFTALVYSVKERESRVEPGLTIKASLRDANRQEVDAITLTTDAFGRIAGAFKLPDDGRLNGRFSIVVTPASMNRAWTTSFMVSDYKLPTFKAIVDEAATGIPAAGDVTLRGSAITYSGMPVADANVEIKVSKANLWRWWSSGSTRKFTPLTITATTDAYGHWEAVLSADSLAPAGKGAWFDVAVTITSSAGESQSASTVFTSGVPIRLDSSIGSIIKVDSNAITLPVGTVNTKGESVDSIDITYALTPIGSSAPALTGSFRSGNAVVDWSTLTPGMYDIEFATDADTLRRSSITIWNPAINRSPSSKPIWIPYETIHLAPDGGGNIILATPEGRDTTWVLLILYDYNSIIERRWLQLAPGLHSIPLEAKLDSAQDLRAKLISFGDYDMRQLDINILPAIDPRALNIRAESMRTNVMAGSTERWTFSVDGASGLGVEAALMLDIYNKAIDALTSAPWRIYGPHFGALSISTFNFSLGSRKVSYLQPYSNNAQKLPAILLPGFQLYGQGLGPQTFRSGRVMLMQKSAMTVGAGNAVYNAPAPTPAPAIMHDTADDAVVEEVAVEATADAGAAAPAPTPDEAFAYRDAETPLALFRPMLSTGADGRLEFSMTFPNANATWVLQALTFSKDMRIASLYAEILAAKPVMVKPNMPRFLRQGDKATVLTSVMNATDEEQTVSVTTEVYNPVDDSIISSNTFTLNLPPRATHTVDAELYAAPGASLIGFRAKASTDKFADGEQSVIPILETSTPVIDSQPFYMGPTMSSTEVSLPAAASAEEAVASLEFCENPIWYVVTALPGLAVDNPSTAPEAARAIFSAAVARGLLDRYPVIAKAIAEWTAAGSDSEVLTSMLERNPDLKTFLLQATPWVNAANNDTERMARLALLLNPSRIDQSINSAVDFLANLVRDGGGWAWIPRLDRASEWATHAVLAEFASLRQLGFMPDNARLNAMIAPAVAFLDAEAERDALRFPDRIQTSFAILRSSFPDIPAAPTTKAIVDSATMKVVADWKDLSLQSKPEAAMFLFRQGHKDEARRILASMREFMSSSPEKGAFFPSIENRAWGYLSYTAKALMAFSTIEPGCSEIDGLCHWLVVQKQTTDWGSSAAATELVAAILSSSPSFIANAKGTVITINGHRASIPAVDSRLGYFRIPVAPASDDIRIDIHKKGKTPAWGSIMRRSVMPLRDVEPASTPDLSIEKSIIGADSLSVGATVTVRLVIRVGRNLNYVAISDARAACFEPVVQLPSSQYSEGVCFYLEPRDAQTSIFVTSMPKGTYVLSYDLRVNNAGEFASGIATAASQYAPEISARSAGQILTVNPATK